MDGIYGILPGVSQMTNIHPLFVHFPIALFNSFFVMEFFGVILKREDLRTAATWMLYLGTLGAVGAVSAGLWAASTVSHTEEVHAIMVRHGIFGITVLTLGVLLSVWRFYVNNKFSIKLHVLHLILAFIMLITMTFGADLGGLMVYKYGVSVKAVPQPKGHVHGGAIHETQESHGDMHMDGEHGHGE